MKRLCGAPENPGGSTARPAAKRNLRAAHPGTLRVDHASIERDRISLCEFLENSSNRRVRSASSVGFQFLISHSRENLTPPHLKGEQNSRFPHCARSRSWQFNEVIPGGLPELKNQFYCWIDIQACMPKQTRRFNDFTFERHFPELITNEQPHKFGLGELGSNNVRIAKFFFWRNYIAWLRPDPMQHEVQRLECWPKARLNRSVAGTTCSQYSTKDSLTFRTCRKLFFLKSNFTLPT